MNDPRAGLSFRRRRRLEHINTLVYQLGRLGLHHHVFVLEGVCELHNISDQQIFNTRVAIL
jgi:hypothetical protein